jgi:hypothetical protein
MNQEYTTDYYQLMVSELRKVTEKYFTEPDPDPEKSALASLEMIRVAKKFRDKFGEKTHAT